MLNTKRTTISRIAILVPLLALAAASCNGDPPTAPDATAAGTTITGAADLDAKSVNAQGAVHVVAGHGVVWHDGSGQWLNTSFHALQMQDGSVNGNWHYQFQSREPRGRIFVQVTCLSVVGNQAWMTGFATQAGNPANIGKWFGLHVIDNGEGHGVVDQIDGTRWFGVDPDAAAEYCATMPVLEPIRAVEAGNVQVR